MKRSTPMHPVHSFALAICLFYCLSRTANASPMQCDGPLAFQQWLLLLHPYTQQHDPLDPWSRRIIRLTYEGDEAYDAPPDGLRREKNWNPFINKGKLLFSQVSRHLPGAALITYQAGSNPICISQNTLAMPASGPGQCT